MHFGQSIESWKLTSHWLQMFDYQFYLDNENFAEPCWFDPTLLSINPFHFFASLWTFQTALDLRYHSVQRYAYAYVTCLCLCQTVQLINLFLEDTVLSTFISFPFNGWPFIIKVLFPTILSWRLSYQKAIW